MFGVSSSLLNSTTYCGRASVLVRHTIQVFQDKECNEHREKHVSTNNVTNEEVSPHSEKQPGYTLTPPVEPHLVHMKHISHHVCISLTLNSR